MYLVDFFKRISRKSSIPVLIYIVLNVFVIAGIMHLFLSANGFPFWGSLLIGIALYAVSLVIALSPIGEWILRLQNECKLIVRPDLLNRIEPLFREVYAQAKQLDPSIPDDVRLYMNSDPEPNAFATGRKTICITEGLLSRSDEQIKATLAHEFGHLAHKDTDLILVVSVGNLIVTATITVIRIVIELFRLFMVLISLFTGGEDGFVGALAGTLYSFLITVAINGLMWIWSKIGILLVMKSSRSNEYEADEFSFNCGYGRGLSLLLQTLDGGHGKGLFANLASSHPSSDKRVARLHELRAAQIEASKAAAE